MTVAGFCNGLGANRAARDRPSPRLVLIVDARFLGDAFGSDPDGEQGNEKLRVIAHELLTSLRKNATTD